MAKSKFTLPEVAPYAPDVMKAFAAKIDSVFQTIAASVQNLVADAALTVPEGGTIAGVPVEELAGNRMLGVFIQVFDDPIEDYWTLRTGSKTGVTYPLNGTTGGKVFAKSDRVRFEFPENIPYDPLRVYRLRARARYTALDGAGDRDWFRWGLVGFAADGTTVVDHLGGNNPMLSHVVGADFQFTSINTFADLDAYITGNGDPGQNVPGPEATPSRLHEDVKYFRPFFEVNYKGGTGAAEVDFIALDVLTVDFEIDALSTVNAPSEAGAQVFDGGDFSQLAQRFFANLLRSVTSTTPLSIIVSQVDDVGDLVETILLDDGVAKRVIAKGKQEGSNVDGDSVTFDPVFQDPPTVLFPPIHLTSKNSFLSPFQHDFVDATLSENGDSQATNLVDEGNGVGKPKTDPQSPIIVCGYDLFAHEGSLPGSVKLDVYFEIDVGATGSWDILGVHHYDTAPSGDDIDLSGVSFTVIVPVATVSDNFRLRVEDLTFRAPAEYDYIMTPRGMHYFLEGETLVKILAEDVTASGFDLVAKLVQRNTTVNEITDVFPAGNITAEGGTKELGPLSGDAGDDEYRAFCDVLMDINSADSFIDKSANLTGILTAAGHTSSEPAVGDASDNQYTVGYSGNVKVTADVTGSPVTDNFPSGVIDGVDEFKTKTLSKDPIGNVTVNWSRVVSAICGACGDGGSANAALSIKVEKNTGSGFSTVATRNYGPVWSAAIGGGSSDTDSGADSVSIAGLVAGNQVRITVTARDWGQSGACCTAIAEADPVSLTYDESGGSGTNTINVKVQAFESAAWVTKNSKNFAVTDTDGVEDTLNISESIVVSSTTATQFRVLLDTVTLTGSVASSSQTINPGTVSWQEGIAESATLTIVIAVDSKDGVGAWIERATKTYVITDTTGNGATQLDQPGELLLFVDPNIVAGDNIRLRAKSVIVTGSADSSSFSIDPVNVKFNTFTATPTEVSATPLSSDRINWVAISA